MFHTIMTYVTGALAIAITFGLAVFVHEFGHMMFALLRGVGVESFAIGMGPKITAWTWKGIEFSLRWFPVGGFVKLQGPQKPEADKGAQALETQEGAEGEKDKDLAESSYDDLLVLSDKGLLTKLMVFGGGVFMNFLAAIVGTAVWLMMSHEVARTPMVIERVHAESVLGQAGVQVGDKIVEVNGQPMVYLENLAEYLEEQLPGEDEKATTSISLGVQRGEQNINIALPAMDREQLGEAFIGSVSYLNPPVVGVLIPTMPAHKAGIKVGDKIISIDGQPVQTFEQMATIIRASLGKEVTLKVERAGQSEPLTFNLEPKPSMDNESEGVIGIHNAPPEKVREAGKPFFTALVMAPGYTVDTLQALWQLQVDFIKKATFKQITDNVGGPIMIAAMTAKAYERGLDDAVQWFVTLNLLLLIFNLLPLPVLDGGFILLALIEGVIRRPVPPRVLGPIYTVFVFLFMGLIIVISLWDVKRWFF